MSGYDAVLELVAENPGIHREEFRELVKDLEGDPDAAVELLEAALNRGDVLRFDGKYWIVRKGKYSYDNYDHPEPD